MKHTEKLFGLIKSLSQPEKSYFKKIKSAFGNSDSIIMKLYKIVAELDEYDEELVVKKLGNVKSKNSFAVKKITLFDDLLDIITLSKSKSSDVQWQIGRLISQAVILKERSLFTEAISVLKKAKNQASKNEFFYKVLEINQQLIEISRKSKTLSDEAALDELEKLRTENLSIGEKIVNAEKFFILSDQLHRKSNHLRHSSNFNLKKEIDHIYADPILSDEKRALSKSALVCFHFIHYFKILNNHDDALKAIFHLKKLIDLQEILGRFPIRSSFVQMGNYVRMAVSANLGKEASEMLKRMHSIVENNKDQFLQIFYFVHLDFYHTHDRNKDEYLSFHKKLELNFDEKSKLPFNMEVMDLKRAQFHYNFMVKNFKKAYRIAHDLENQYNLNSFKKGKFIEKVLKVICAYELDDGDLINAEIRSAKYLLKSIKDPLPSELKIFDTVVNITKAKSTEKKNEIIADYLENCDNESHNEKVTFLLHGFRFKIWAKTQLDKSDYLDGFFKKE